MKMNRNAHLSSVCAPSARQARPINFCPIQIRWGCIFLSFPLAFLPFLSSLSSSLSFSFFALLVHGVTSEQQQQPKAEPARMRAALVCALFVAALASSTFAGECVAFYCLFVVCLCVWFTHSHILSSVLNNTTVCVHWIGGGEMGWFGEQRLCRRQGSL